MKPVDVKWNTYIDSSKEIIKILYLKLVILLEYQNITLQIFYNILHSKLVWRSFLIKKVKSTMP